jgi:4-amino-4-deoxy-L-arabinose transferase-like glycosyltransferase
VPSIHGAIAPPLARFRMVVWLASLFLLLLAALVTRSRGLWSPDELRFAQIVQGMDQFADLFVLKLRGSIYTEKPPLFFWLVRATTPVTGGLCLVTLLAPVVFASCTLLWLTGHIASKWYGLGTGITAVAILATLPLFLLLSSIGRMDMLLALFVTAAVYALHQGYAAGLARFRLLAFVSMGAGVLAKGPFAVVFPVAIAVTALAISRKLHRVWCRETALGIVIVGAIVGIWLGPAAWIAGMEFLAALIERQVLARAVAGLDHREPAYFYLWVLPIIVLPWALFLIPSMRAAWSRWRERGEQQDVWLLAWLVVPLLILSLVREKLPVYLLPAMPPVAMLVGRYWTDLYRAGALSRRIQLRLCGLYLIGASLGCAAIGVSMLIDTASDAGARKLGNLLTVSLQNDIAWLMLDPKIIGVGGGLLVAIAAAGFYSIRTLANRGIAWAFGTLASIAPCVQLFFILIIMPALDPSQSWRAVVNGMNTARLSGEPVVAYGLRPFAAYYTDHDVTWFKKQDSLEDCVRRNGAIWCAARERELAELTQLCAVERRPGDRYPSPSGPIVLVRLRPLTMAAGTGATSGGVRR